VTTQQNKQKKGLYIVFISYMDGHDTQSRI
jgi:hypothetical protein